MSFVIQKDNESETIELKAVDDTYVEYLHELLKITAENAIHGEQAYQVVTPDTVEIDIEDNDEFELHWAEFEDHLGMIADPSSGLDYSGHHWLDNNRNGVIEPAEGDKKLPVAYQSGNPVKETARFVGIIDPTYSGETLTFSASVSADPGGGAAGPPAPLDYKTFNVTAGSGEVVLSSVELTTLAANTARHFDDFNVVWLFQFAAEPQLWRGAGAQENDLYATYQGALTGQYHTVIHLGSHFASGKSSQSTVFDAIWANFKLLGVSTHDGQALHYYGLAPVNPAFDAYVRPDRPSLAREQSVFQVAQLLTHKDGTCGAWSRLFDGALEAQGLAGDRRVAAVIGFDSFRVNTLFAGQNSASPRETIWPNHALVLYTDENNVSKYYDPSYGKEYTSVTAWAKASIVSYGVIAGDPRTYTATLNVNPSHTPFIIEQDPPD